MAAIVCCDCMAEVQAMPYFARTRSLASPKAAPVLKEAQRNWIAFRDKSCEYQSVYFQGGTAGGPAASGCMLELTAQQALRLRTVPGSGQ